MTLEELRARFPQYSQISDLDFLMGVHRKMYPDVHMKQFINAIGGADLVYATADKDSPSRQYYKDAISQPLPNETPEATAQRLRGTAQGPVGQNSAQSIFEVQGQDGKIYEVQASSLEQAAAAVTSRPSNSGPQYDAMGFPLQPQGGVSTNSQAVSELGSGLKSVAAGAANGASLGFADEGLGLAGGLKSLAQGNGYLPGYRAARDDVRDGMKQAQQANPLEFGVGNIGGAMVPALATGGLATGASTLGTIGRGAVLGAVEGGLQGAGNADGGDMLGQAKTGAFLGGIAGGAAPAAVALGRNAIRNPVTGAIDSMFGIANGRKANDAIYGALKSSGNTRDDIAAMMAKAAQQGQPEFRLMDALGTSGQRQASGLARQGGDAGTEIADFLKQRQLDQGDRVGGFVEDAFGLRGTTAAKTKDALTAARGTAADAAYSAARGNAAPVDVRGALGVIDSRIGGMQGSGIIGDGIDGKLAGYRARLAGDGNGLGAGVTGAELSDFDRVLNLKQAVQDDIGAAIRAGRNNEARELGKLVTELDSALEGSSDMYRTANDGFREASKVIGAVDEGAAMSGGGRYGDNVPAFNAMTPDQQGAARIGYGDDLMGKLERVTAPTANRAAPLRSTKRVNEADAMTLDPALYRDRLGRENTMWETQNRALGGSRTADNMADQEAMSQLAGGAIAAARSAANANLGDAVAKIGSMLGPIAKGQNEATRQLIAKALMSGDSSVLAPVMQQATSTESKRRMIEALLRQTGREGGEALAR
jgi:hypothetical protein